MNFLYKNNILKKTFHYLLIAIALFPLLGMRIAVYVIGSWCLAALLLIIKSKSYKTSSSNWKSLLVLCSYFILLIIFFLFTDDTHEALKKVERKIPFLIFPVFLYFTKDLIDNKVIKKVLFTFSFATVVSMTYIWILILNIGFISMLETDTYYNPVFRNLFSNTTKIHLPYLGLIYGFSAIVLIHFLRTLRIKFYNRVLLLIPIGFLLFSIILFSARTAILAFIIGSSYYLIKTVRKRIALIIVTCIIFSTVVFSFLPPIQRRVKEITEMKMVLPSKEQNSDKVNFRYAIYYCSLGIVQENWLTGLGLGSVQKELNKCYNTFDYTSNFDDFSSNQYNSHNQYLNEWMTYGLVGLFLIIFFLFYCFKRGNLLHQSFLIMIILGLITENLFEREVGILFFAYFNTLFFIENLKKNNSYLD